MTTYLDDCDLDAAKPLRTLVWKFVRAQFAANDPDKCRYSLVLCAKPRIVPLRVVVFVSLNVMEALVPILLLLPLVARTPDVNHTDVFYCSSP